MVLFLMLLLTPIYLWRSGTPQLAHIVGLIFIISNVLVIKNIKFTNKIFILTIIFILFVAIINSLYYIIYYDEKFIWSSIYYIYDALIFISMYISFKKNSHSFFKIIRIASFISIFLQLIIYYCGFGNDYFYPRYSGTFNDPNQMAYWVLASFAMFYYSSLDCKNGLRNSFILLICVIYLLSLTISRSSIVPIGIIIISIFFWKKIVFKYFFYNLSFLILMISISTTLLYFNITNNSGEFFAEINNRLVDIKINKEADIRGYTRLFDYSGYILFGAGEGEHNRFNQDKIIDFQDIEVHSTWVGLFHYYGLIPALLFIYLIYKCQKNIALNYKFVFLATLFFGFTTYTLRTPIFWILLSVIFCRNQSMVGSKS